MNKFLCGFGIFILVILILLPPTLRIFVPKEEEVEEEKEELIVRALSCNGDNYIARTSYENDNVQMILIKKNIISTDKEEENNEEVPSENPEENQEVPNENTETTPEETPNEENQPEEDTNPDTSSNLENFEAMFTRLSDDSRVARDDMDDGIVLTIDFSISDNSRLDIGDLTKPIDDQKSYYEDLGLVCSIIE